MVLGVDTGGKPRGHVKLGGLWWYLIARVQGRTLERLEQLRDEATARAIQMLPPGAELEEYETHGRYRRIRIPVFFAAAPCSQSEVPSSARVLSAQDYWPGR